MKALAAGVALVVLAGCPINPGCGPVPSDVYLAPGSYEEVLADTGDASTPFAEPPPASTLEVAESEVVFTYVNAEGHTVVITYAVVDEGR